MAKKEASPHFVANIPLVREQWVDDKLFSIFIAAHHLYNDCVAEIIERLDLCEKEEEYIKAQEKIKELYKKQDGLSENSSEYKAIQEAKEIYFKIQDKVRDNYGLSANGQRMQTNILVPIKNKNPKKYVGINSAIYSNISSDLAKKLHSYFYSNGKRIKFKQYQKGETITSLTGNRDRKKDDWYGIKLCIMSDYKLYVELVCSYYKMDNKGNLKCPSRSIFIPLLLTKDNLYSINQLFNALDMPICETKEDIYKVCQKLYMSSDKPKKIKDSAKTLVYLPVQTIGPVSIKYQQIREHRYYSVDICIDGVPNQKYGLNSLDNAATNIVGIDMGMQVVSLCYRHKNGEVFNVEMFELAEDIDKDYMETLSEINRSMEHKRRLNNPDNFTEDGQIKRGVKLNWMSSQNYKDEKLRYQNLNRKKTVITKIRHTELVKHIINQAYNVVIEPMDYSGLAKKAQETTTRTIIDENGHEHQRFNSKKRYGGSINKKSPALFMNLLKIATKEVGGTYTEVDKWDTKASQYNHQTNEYIKKDRSVRWNYLSYHSKEIKIQRDLYSAFLLANIDNSKRIDKYLCDIGFDSFVMCHNLCLSELDMTSQAIKNIL